jgi:hypothetical protein
MRPGDLVRLKPTFAESNWFGDNDISRESVGVVVRIDGKDLRGGLQVLMEGRVINMFEYELDVISEEG